MPGESGSCGFQRVLQCCWAAMTGGPLRPVTPSRGRWLGVGVRRCRTPRSYDLDADLAGGRVKDIIALIPAATQPKTEMNIPIWGEKLT